MGRGGRRQPNRDGGGRRRHGSDGGQGAHVVYTDRASGIRFVFKRDPDDLELLHIYARHLTTPQEAIRTFFDGDTRWNERYQRFETSTDTHALYWYWLEPRKAVMAISCFTLGAS